MYSVYVYMPTVHLQGGGLVQIGADKTVVGDGHEGCKMYVPHLDNFCKEQIGKVVGMTANDFYFIHAI